MGIYNMKKAAQRLVARTSARFTEIQFMKLWWIYFRIEEKQELNYDENVIEFNFWNAVIKIKHVELFPSKFNYSYFVF